MTIKTEAVVISSLPFGESGKIFRCYTKTSGIKSFLSKGIHSKKNKLNALIFPLNQIEIIYDERGKDLNFIKEIRTVHHYENLNQNPLKISVSLFISEVLQSVLKEEEANGPLFQFIIDGLRIFDEKTYHYSDFHLWFLLNLTSHLGFYPNVEENEIYFDLISGNSSNTVPSEFYLTGEKLDSFKKLNQLNFSDQHENLFHQKQRKEILETLILYYELHNSGFRRPKSIEILNQVFS